MAPTHNPDHYAYSRLARDNGDKMLAYLRGERFNLEEQRREIETRLKNCNDAISAQERNLELLPVEPARIEQRQEEGQQGTFLPDGSQDGASVDDKATAAVADALKTGSQEA